MKIDRLIGILSILLQKVITAPELAEHFEVSRRTIGRDIEALCKAGIPIRTMQAAFYLRFLPDSYKKYIVMLKAHHPKRQESLAEYYYRMNHHLLSTVKVAEYDPEKKILNIVGQTERK